MMEVMHSDPSSKEPDVGFIGDGQPPDATLQDKSSCSHQDTLLLGFSLPKTEHSKDTWTWYLFFPYWNGQNLS